MANCEFCKMQDNCPGLNDCVHREDNTEPVAWRHKEYHYMTSATKWSDDCVPLYTAPQPAVPAGWQLVPVEPTEGMIDKVIDERYNALLTGKDHTLIDVYKAMLAANPETIKQLIELVRLQNSVLRVACTSPQNIDKYHEAIAAFDRFEKGEK